MSFENIDKFNLFVGRIFAILASEFPLKKSFAFCEIVGVKSEFDTPINSDEKIVLASVEWLSENGYISLKSFNADKSVSGVVLTCKGLTLLNQVPTSLKNDTILTKLKNAVNLSSEEALKSVTQNIISLMATMIK